MTRDQELAMVAKLTQEINDNPAIGFGSPNEQPHESISGRR